MHFIDRTLRELELVCLNVEDFTQTDFRELFKIVSGALDQDDEDPSEYVRARIPDENAGEFLIEADQNPIRIGACSPPPPSWKVP